MAASTNDSPKVKKVPIRERSFTMGNVVGINGYRINHSLLKQRFAEGGYWLQETPHFLIFTRSEGPSPIVVHWFAPDEIDANIGDYFVQELKPHGILVDEQDFGNLFGAIVFSLSPHDAQCALHLYGSNTFHQYRYLLNISDDALPASQSTIHSFARLYRRVCQLHIGQTFLDVGCSFGFLPLLISERYPSLTQILGVDIQTSPFPVITAIAEEQHLQNINFEQADVLIDTFSTLGRFDTVVALHVLEHLTEADMYRALSNLLKVTSRRLIIAVPYEDEKPEIVYGHEQLFNRAKLEAIGNWCFHHLDSPGSISVEDCVGGLLLVERSIA
ncbi:MAG TPA: class I SAM-dependent methyltransferase [Ktedonobacteraceae bacterium]|nr:class I SAM-dependent methyltransferase [Ktedonobacteraceae bacterium]